MSDRTTEQVRTSARGGYLAAAIISLAGTTAGIAFAAGAEQGPYITVMIIVGTVVSVCALGGLVARDRAAQHETPRTHAHQPEDKRRDRRHLRIVGGGH